MAGHIAGAPARAALATVALAGLGTAVLALPASAQATVPRPSTFTSTYTVQATAQEVVADSSGDSTASAAFVLELNSDMDVLCYSITTRGVEPPYMSPARTSTHLHEAPAGQSGPPRIVFVDPTSGTDSDPRTSAECMQGPFTTGVTAPSGGDTGAGFTVAELEANPSDYYVDIHTAKFPGGSLRGQLPAADGSTASAAAAPPAAPAAAAPAPAAPAPAAAAPAPAAQAPAPAAQAPVGGVAAGFGGLAGDDTVAPATAALAAALLALAAGLTGGSLLRGRRRTQG